MAEVAGYSFPDASAWPYVWIDGYWDIVRNVIPTSLGTGMNLAPIVDPAVVNVTEFEDFVYGKFAEVFPEYPDMGARSHFGKGIWGTLRSLWYTRILCYTAHQLTLSFLPNTNKQMNQFIYYSITS